MNLEGNQPYYVSLHYDETMWHKAIIQGIKPFIENTKDIKTCVFKLNRELGDSIRMAILLNENTNTKVFAQYIDDWFKNFLLKYPSTLSKSLIAENALFLNFKNNSIHYGTFLMTTEFSNDIFNSYVKNVSEVVIEIFESYKEETLTNLIEIFIQLFTIFCNAFYLENEEAEHLFELLLESEFKKYNDQTLKKINVTNKKNFEENKNSLVEYIKENRNNTSKDLEEKWEILWFSTVRNCYKQLKKKSDKSKELSFLINYLSEVFDLENRITTYYLFHQSLKHL